MSYHIRVNCTCRKVLKIPEKYAGKRIRCPNCDKAIDIPTIDEIRQKTTGQPEEPEARHCPTCGAYLDPGDDVCVSCRTNLKTGEWEGKKVPPSTPGRLQYIGFAAICALLLSSGIYFFMHLKPGEPAPVENTLGNRTGTIESKRNTDEASLQHIGAPDPSVAAQREALAEREYQEVLQQTQEREDALLRWLKFKEIAAKYHDTDYIQKIHEQGNPLAQAVKMVREEKDNIRRAFEERQYAETAVKGTQWLGHVVAQTYPEEELRTALGQCTEICLKAAVNCKNPATPPQQKQPENPVTSQDQELLAIQEKLAMYRQDENGQWMSLDSYYTNKAKKWEFAALMSELAPMAEKAAKLKEKYPDNADLERLLGLYREVEDLDRFWKCVEEALSLLREQKKKVNLLLKEGESEVETGTILDYRDGMIRLSVTKGENSAPETKTFALRDLSARGIVMLVALTRDKSKKFYATAAAFYYINGDPYECRSFCDKALETGAPMAEVLKYLEWCNQTIGKTEKTVGKPPPVEDSGQKMEEIRAKAWTLIDNELLPAYKRDNTRLIFKLLGDLKGFVPRDELVKLNSEVLNKRGQSLYSIADKAFCYCTHCKDSGKVKCPPCRGDGYIETTINIKEGETTNKKYCDRCGGSGEIYCPKCYSKRHNRTYKMLVDFYDEID